MSLRYRVEWSDEAHADVATIFDYLWDRNPPAADAFLDEIEQAALSLERLPERGRWLPEMEGLSAPSSVRPAARRYRELILAPWRLIYRVNESSVNILTVVDSHRDLSEVMRQLPERG